MRSGLGVVVCGGVLSSLVLTLALVPVMYVWLAPKKFAERAQAPSTNGVTHTATVVPVRTP
ncbi:MAG: hypothetical protein ACXVAR_00885 [Vulcanimicrobiaceae bacterium]